MNQTNKNWWAVALCELTNAETIEHVFDLNVQSELDEDWAIAEAIKLWSKLPGEIKATAYHYFIVYGEREKLEEHAIEDAIGDSSYVSLMPTIEYLFWG